jgi:poly-gamma-glutamate synthesis protein (capsule biosynthesis protein)
LVFATYESYDISSNWQQDSLVTYNNTQYSLKLLGNNSKFLSIPNHEMNSNEVWSVFSKINQSAHYIGFGVSDDTNKLIYIFRGSTLLENMEYEIDYQGAFNNSNWNEFLLPIAQDWFSRYDYYPVINKLIFLNKGSGVVYFDEIYNVTDILPQAPLVSFRYNINPESSQMVNFYSQIDNPNPNESYNYYWQFGDSTYSSEQNPVHIYTNSYHSSFKVNLDVKSSNGKWGRYAADLSIENVESLNPVTLSFVGDIMLARRVNTAIAQGYGDLLFEDCRNQFEESDLSIANLESCLSNSNQMHPTKPIKFKGSPQNAAVLQDNFIDIVSLANNHIYDCLYTGIFDTQSALDNYNIRYSGAGVNEYEASQPIIVNKNGKSLAFLCSSDRNGSYNNYQPFLQAAYNKSGFYNLQPSSLRYQLKNTNNISDFQIALLHSGSEYSLQPGQDYDKTDSSDEDYDDMAPKIDYPHLWDMDLRHFAIDNGADLLINHHSHIVQGFEMYNGKLIAHSLGNFIFDLDRLDTRFSVILNAELHNEGFKSYQIIPFFINNITPKRLNGFAAEKFLNYLQRKSNELNTLLLFDPVNYSAKVIEHPEDFVNSDSTYEKIVSFPGNSNLSNLIFTKKFGDFLKFNNIPNPDLYNYRLGNSTVFFSDFEDPAFNIWSFSDNDISYSTENPFNGNYSIRMNNFNNYAKSVSSTLPFRILSNNPKSVTLSYKTNLINTFSVTVSYQNISNNSTISEESFNLSATPNSWNTVVLDLNPDYEASAYSIKIQAVSSNPDAYICIDCFDVIDWSDWISDFSIEQKIPNPYSYVQIKRNGGNNTIMTELTEAVLIKEVVSSNDNCITQPVQRVFNYPNPFNPETNIRFDLKTNSHVSINIYNVKGQRVNSLFKGILPSGLHSFPWKGLSNSNKPVSSGIYFYEIKTGDYKVTRKMLLIK